LISNNGSSLDASQINSITNGFVIVIPSNLIVDLLRLPKPSTPAQIRNGTNNLDNMIGTSENDKMFGLEGNDSIFGLSNDDVMFGVSRNDSIFGG